MHSGFEFRPQGATHVAQPDVKPGLSVLRFENGVLWNQGLCFLRSGFEFQSQRATRLVQQNVEPALSALGLQSGIF